MATEIGTVPATIGHLEVEVLIRTKDGEPVAIGTIDLPVSVAYKPGHMGTLVVDPAQVRAAVARMYGRGSVAPAEPVLAESPVTVRDG
jgi:hypothetical protein